MWAALGKGGSVSPVILLIFEQPEIKVNSVLSFFFYDRKDYGIKQPIVITAKKPKTTFYGGRAIIL